jgi:integrase
MGVKITKKLVTSIQPNGKRFEVFDAELPGFSLRVTAAGVKTFAVSYRAGPGRGAPKRRITLGRYGPVTPDAAREEARQILAAVARGEDPAEDRDRDKAAPTLGDLAVEWLEDVKARRKPRTLESYTWLWNDCIKPALGKYRVQDVTTQHVAAMHRKLRPTPYKANRALAVVGVLFTYAERQGLRPKHSNPAHELAPYPERSRERYLTPDEFTRLLAVLERAEREGVPPAPNRTKPAATGATAKHRPKSADTLKPANPWAIAAIRFLALTGWREREALSLRWADIDLARNVALLPDTKTGRSPRPVGAAAVALLDSLPRAGQYVFPGRKPKSHLTEINRVWYAVRHAARLDDVRLHDLRHSFASVIASAGGSLLFIAKLLGHKDHTSAAKYSHLLDDPVRAIADAAGAQISEWGNGGVHND